MLFKPFQRGLPARKGSGIVLEGRERRTPMRLAIVSVMLILAITLVVTPAMACSCAFAGPPCRAVQDASAVFLGKVLAIEKAESAGGYEFYSRRVRFEIVEPFTGVSGATTEVYTGEGGGDCGYGFRTGRSYVVYAYRETTSPRLTTGICSRTRPANDAEEDLSYLRMRNDRARGSGIEGYAFRLKRDRNGNTYWDSYAEGVTLVVESGAQSWELKNGKEGKFALWKLAPGTYHLRASDPKAHIVSVTPPSVELPAKGCAHVIVTLTPEWRPARR